jgi:hypothetical protein
MILRLLICVISSQSKTVDASDFAAAYLMPQRMQWRGVTAPFTARVAIAAASLPIR